MRMAGDDPMTTSRLVLDHDIGFGDVPFNPDNRFPTRILPNFFPIRTDRWFWDITAISPNGKLSGRNLLRRR